MNRLRQGVCGIAVWAALGWTLAARAQATQPVDAEWSKVVEAVSRALAEGDASALAAAVAEPATAFRKFNSTSPEDYAGVLAITQHGVVISAHAYFHPSLGIAADIAADFKKNTVVPETVKRRMVPADDEEMRRAKATAVQWAEQSLAAKSGDSVGIVILWCAKKPGAIPTSEPPPHELVFVLLKGDSSHKVSRVVYGDPLADAK